MNGEACLRQLGQVAYLQGDGGRRVLRQLEAEGMRAVAQLLEQLVLQLRDWKLVCDGGKDLLRCEIQLAREVQAHDLIFFTSVAKDGHHLSEDATSTKIVRIHDYDAFNWIAAGTMISEVTIAEIDSQLAARRRLLEDAHCHNSHYQLQ